MADAEIREKKFLRLEQMKNAGRRRIGFVAQKSNTGTGIDMRKTKKSGARKPRFKPVITNVTSLLNSEYMPFTWTGHIVAVEDAHVVARLADEKKPGLHKMVRFARTKFTMEEQEMLEPGISLVWRFSFSKAKQAVQPHSIKIQLLKADPLTNAQLNEARRKAKEVINSIFIE